MKYINFIPCVNRFDLLTKAIKSVPNTWNNIRIIDNSENNLKDYLKKEIGFDFTVLEPPVPLTTAQTYNWIRKMAIKEELDYLMFMHNDSEVLTENGDLKLIEASEEEYSKQDSKVGAIHHNNDWDRDVFITYSVKMLKDIGEWDWLCMPFYWLDIDFNRRFEKHGWTFKTIDVLCEHHCNASATIKSDKLRGLINGYYYSVSEVLMKIKWSRYSGDWRNLE
jgi:hypothetical protein